MLLAGDNSNLLWNIKNGLSRFLEIAHLLLQILDDYQRFSKLGLLLRDLAVCHWKYRELVGLRFIVFESDVCWRPRRQIDRRSKVLLLAQDAINQFS